MILTNRSRSVILVLSWFPGPFLELLLWEPAQSSCAPGQTLKNETSECEFLILALCFPRCTERQGRAAEVETKEKQHLFEVTSPPDLETTGSTSEIR